MSDAITEGYQMQDERKAEEDFLTAVIYYLQTPSPENLQKVNTAMEEIAKVFRGENTLADIKNTFELIIKGEHKVWHSIAEREENGLFKQDPTLRELFYEAGKKKGVGGLKYVI